MIKPYYQDDYCTIYHGDCREVLPQLDKVDLVLKKGLTNSTKSATMGHDEKQKRKRQEGEGASHLGTAQSGDGVALLGAEVVNGADSELLQSVADGNRKNIQKNRDSVEGSWEKGQRERKIQGREAKQVVSSNDRERQVCGMRGDGAAGDPSQEWGSLRQSPGKPTDPMLVMPQQQNEETILGQDQGKWAIVSDPPYGIGYVHSKGGGCLARSTRFADVEVAGDRKPFDPSEFLDFPVVILWGANHFASRLPDSPCWLVWDKRDGITSNDQADCELAWTSLRKPARLMRHRWNGMIKASERGQQRVHPTQKPVSLMVWCISFVPNNLTILDPFLGSGTTLRAAKDLQRKAIGIEIEEKYCEIAVKRLQQEVLAL